MRTILAVVVASLAVTAGAVEPLTIELSRVGEDRPKSDHAFLGYFQIHDIVSFDMLVRNNTTDQTFTIPFLNFVCSKANKKPIVEEVSGVPAEFLGTLDPGEEHRATLTVRALRSSLYDNGLSDFGYVTNIPETLSPEGDGVYLEIVPEPASLIALGIGALAIVKRRSKR